MLIKLRQEDASDTEIALGKRGSWSLGASEDGRGTGSWSRKSRSEPPLRLDSPPVIDFHIQLIIRLLTLASMRLRKSAIVRIRPLKDCTVSLLFLSILLSYVTLRGNEGAGHTTSNSRSGMVWQRERLKSCFPIKRWTGSEGEIVCGELLSNKDRGFWWIKNGDNLGDAQSSFVPCDVRFSKSEVSQQVLWQGLWMFASNLSLRRLILMSHVAHK